MLPRTAPLIALLLLICLGTPPSAFALATDTENEVGVPKKLNLPPGFKSEVVYVVPRNQGSWVSMTTDPKGRLVASDQHGKIYRIVPGADGKETSVEALDVKVGRAQGLLCAFDSLYAVTPPNKESTAGLYRCRDTNGDDQYDEVKLLREFKGWRGEHGPHAVVLGPEGKSLYICAGNMTEVPGPDTSRVPQKWDEDQFVPRLPDANGHATGVMAPGGWVCKTDPDGKSFELICNGFRNEYDIAFAPNGELFTYDADMEYDVGLPWYRPTRVCHVVSGGEFGWRNGSGKWPKYYPDSLPPVCEVGPASPTGLTFGTGTKFPTKYQNALFMGDWSYGVIYAVHLKQDGASWTGDLERFCYSNALPVTDMVVRKTDGALYFLIGGRRSQSALFRVTYTGDESTAAPAPWETAPAIEKRRQLEKTHVSGADVNIDELWKDLTSEDRFIRFSARVGLEHQGTAKWQDRIESASTPWQAIECAVAVGRCGDFAAREKAATSLSKLDFGKLTKPQQLAFLRAHQLLLLRSKEKVTQAVENLAALDQYFPAGDIELDRELSIVLMSASPTTGISKTVDLLKKAGSQHEQVAYALYLASAKSGWTPELHETYFNWFLDSSNFQGGRSFGGYVRNIRKMAIGNLSAEQKEQMADLLAKKPETKDPYADLKARPVVKEWKVDDLLPVKEEEFKTRNLENGKNMFAVGGCYKCHRLGDSGGIVGPDLTAAGNRFNTRDMLETLIEPSKSISDQYSSTAFALDDGRVVVGRVVNLSGKQYWVQPDMINPEKLIKINVDSIEDQEESEISPMPLGLLNTMTREDILDLIGYMRTFGKQE